jgi:hypothetical protein
MKRSTQQFTYAAAMRVVFCLVLTAILVANIIAVASENRWSYRIVASANEIFVVLAACHIYSTSMQLRTWARVFLVSSAVFIGSHFLCSGASFGWIDLPAKSPTDALCMWFWRLRAPENFVYNSELAVYLPVPGFLLFERPREFRAAFILSLNLWISIGMVMLTTMVKRPPVVEALNYLRVSWRIGLLQLFAAITIFAMFFSVLRIYSLTTACYLGYLAEVTSLICLIASFVASGLWQQGAKAWLVTFYSCLGFRYAAVSTLSFGYDEISMSAAVARLLSNLLTRDALALEKPENAELMDPIYFGHCFLWAAALAIATFASLSILCVVHRSALTQKAPRSLR